MLKPPYCIDTSSLGLLGVRGMRAKELLQGQLTCHMDEVSPNHSSLAAHCNPKGRVISLFRIFLYHDIYYLLMPIEMIPIAKDALQKYAVFFKVELFHELTLPKIIYCTDALAFANAPQAIDEACENNGTLIIKLSPENTYLLLGDISLTKNIPVQKIYPSLDIKAEIPNIYPETTEKFLPHELNLPNLNAVSFNKGCYTGQEIIARMQYRGKIKTKLYRGTTTHLPQKGADIYDAQGNATGMIVDFYQNAQAYEILFTSSAPSPLFIDTAKTMEIQI
jgi:folate-binding protein YgfZ